MLVDAGGCWWIHTSACQLGGMCAHVGVCRAGGERNRSHRTSAFPIHSSDIHPFHISPVRWYGSRCCDSSLSAHRAAPVREPCVIHPATPLLSLSRHDDVADLCIRRLSSIPACDRAHCHDVSQCRVISNCFSPPQRAEPLAASVSHVMAVPLRGRLSVSFISNRSDMRRTKQVSQ